MPEFYMTLLDFDPGSNYLPNGDFETSSYWQGSIDNGSFSIQSSLVQYGSGAGKLEIDAGIQTLFTDTCAGSFDNSWDDKSNDQCTAEYTGGRLRVTNVNCDTAHANLGANALCKTVFDCEGKWTFSFQFWPTSTTGFYQDQPYNGEGSCDFRIVVNSPTYNDSSDSTIRGYNQPEHRIGVGDTYGLYIRSNNSRRIGIGQVLSSVNSINWVISDVFTYDTTSGHIANWIFDFTNEEQALWVDSVCIGSASVASEFLNDIGDNFSININVHSPKRPFPGFSPGELFIEFDDFTFTKEAVDIGSNYFYHKNGAVTLAVNTSYYFKFSAYAEQAGQWLRAELVTNDNSSVFFVHSFEMISGKWLDYSFPFSVAAPSSDFIVRFSAVSSVSAIFYFDDVKIETEDSWNTSSVIQIYPDFQNYKRGQVKDSSDHRTKGGKLYSYRWSEHERFEIPLTFVANSKANIINSWWSKDASLLLKINSGNTWETNSVTFVNKKRPLDKRAKPYPGYWNGTLELETL